MKKPNAMASEVLKKAADNYSKIGDIYDQMADIARRYAVAMRDGDTEQMVALHDGLHSDTLGITQECQLASAQMKLLAVADPEWRAEFANGLDKLKISKCSLDQLAFIVIQHSANCPKLVHECEIHSAIEKRINELDAQQRR